MAFVLVIGLGSKDFTTLTQVTSVISLYLFVQGKLLYG